MAKSKKVVPINPLVDVMREINKVHGDGASVFMSDSPNRNIAAMPTGLLALDAALGIGGLPKGRIVEIYGQPTSGKSTLTLQMIATIQKAGGQAVYVDTEHAMDAEYMGSLGVDTTDKLPFSQPSSAEEALDIVFRFAKCGMVDLIVVDSIPALTPLAEIQGKLTDKHMAPLARLLGQALRTLVPIASKTKTTVVFINQLREKMNASPWESKFTTPGGKTMKYQASIQLDMQKREAVKDKDKNPIGHYSYIKVAKNKVSPPFYGANVLMMSGRGFDQNFDILEAGLKTGIVEQDGATYSFGDLKIGYGKDNAIDAIRDDAGMAEDLRAAITHAINERRGRHPISAEKLKIDEETGEVADAAE